MNSNQKSLVKLNKSLTLPKDVLRILLGTWIMSSPWLGYVTQFNLLNFYTCMSGVITLGFCVLGAESLHKRIMKYKESEALNSIKLKLN